MTFKTVEVEILRYHPVAAPTPEKVYYLYDGDREVVYCAERYDLSMSAKQLNRPLGSMDI